LRRGAELHDIGKISIPEPILDKPGPLTPEEFAIVKQHPLQGIRMVEPLQSLRDVFPIIRSHHERLDGTGYPDGLRGDEISLLVRAVSVADVFDALASHRPYRPALPYDKCVAIMRDNAAGGGLDPDVVELFATIPHEALQACAMLGAETAVPLLIPPIVVADAGDSAACAVSYLPPACLPTKA
jgi:putative two-component system response regulator